MEDHAAVRSQINKLEQRITLLRQKPRKRPALFLLYEAAANGVKLAITRPEVADLCAMSLGHVSRSWAPLRKHGIIKVGRGKVEVLKPEALRKAALKGLRP